MLLLSLMFEPSDGDNSEDEKETQGKLKVQIKQAEDLRPDDLNAQINPFARCYLLPNQLVDCKKKTGVVINTLNPVWNSEIEYPHVSLEDLESSRALEVTIWDRDRRGVNEFIGGIRLGPDPLACSDSTEWMDSIEDEVTHWEAALARPGEWVEQWHNLRPSMSSLNQNAKKERHRPTPSTYGQEIATSVTSLSSSTDSEAEIPVTNSDSVCLYESNMNNIAVHFEMLVLSENTHVLRYLEIPSHEETTKRQLHHSWRDSCHCRVQG